MVKNVSNKDMEAVVASLTGRKGITVSSDSSKSAYSIMQQNIDVGTETIATLMGVPEDNLPPNIPEELTPALLKHLFMLHEAEHVTQHRYKIDEGSGYIDPGTIEYTFVDVTDYRDPTSVDNMQETDSDMAVITHLDDMELPHVAQFWLDARISASFTHKFIDTIFDPYEHDAASLANYARQTGDVIDPDVFIAEKNDLMTKIQPEIMGADAQALSAVLSQYPQIIRDRDMQAEFLRIAYSDDYNLKPDVRPQTIMHVVQGLLDDGKLEGLQKWEAQNYVEAMERLGYEPEAPSMSEMSYEEQLRDILENKMGLSPEGDILPKSGLRPDEMELEAPQGSAIQVTQ